MMTPTELADSIEYAYQRLGDSDHMKSWYRTVFAPFDFDFILEALAIWRERYTGVRGTA